MGELTSTTQPSKSQVLVRAIPIEELLTISDIAAIIKTKEKTIRQWVYQGKIPSLKVNGLLRFSPKDIMTWLKNAMRGGQ